MKILFIAPLPPPMHGQAFISSYLLSVLKKENEVEILNTSKKINRNIINRISRIIKVIQYLLQSIIKSNNVDIIYLTISESFWGNIKDILIYLINISKISKFILHIHGGSFYSNILERNILLRLINLAIFKRAKFILVSGNSHKRELRKYYTFKNIITCANYADEQIFLSQTEVTKKTEKISLLKIIYFSKMTKMKGYDKLLLAIQGLKDEVRKKIEVIFVGGFESKHEEKVFYNLIKDIEEIKYLGIVKDEEIKRKVFKQGHVFCLPTSHLEGQPVSILEAYAAGCIVITTGPPGILDIFNDRINGFLIRENTPQNIALLIEMLVNNMPIIKRISENNIRYANRYFTNKIFIKNVMKAFRENTDG